MSPHQPIAPIPSQDYPETIHSRLVLNELKSLAARLSKQETDNFILPTETPEYWNNIELSRNTPVLPASLVSGLSPFALQCLSILLGWKPHVRRQKIERLISLSSAILDAFEPQGVEILPLIKVPQKQPIDLFIRFPGKEFLLFNLRSFGEATIVYNETTQLLYYKRGRKGSNKWKPDPLLELSDQAYWIRKHRRALFGSSKGARKPMPKVLVICGDTQLQQHQAHLYKRVDNQQFLFLPRDCGACFVIYQQQLIDFIRAHLNAQISKE